MRAWWRVPFNEEELRGLRDRLDAEQLQAGDYELLDKMIRETKRLSRRLWWMARIERMLRRMLTFKNWVRVRMGKPPLIPEEWDDNGR